MASLDAERIDAEKALGPLWGSTEVPDDVRQIHDTFLDALAQDPDWQFWRRWYLEMWNGTFQDWSLANEIAVIEDDLWEGDDALSKVAARIRDIEARRVERELPQVDEVFLDTNGLYEVRSVFREPADLLDGIFNRVSFAFDTAVQSNSCDLNGTSLAAKILRQALENCRDDPNAVEQYFREAVSFIEGNIADGHFAEDDELGFLVNTLKETALQLRADHPTVAEASDARLKRRLKEIDERKALELAESIENMREGTGQRLSEQFALAAETARAMHAPQAQASAIRRSANHAAKISLKESARSASDLAKKAESSGFMASIKMSMRADKLVDLVNWLISGGG